MSPYQFKVLLTIASAVVVVVISFLVTPGHKDDDRWWKGGKRDPFYQMLYTSDGVFRKHAKLVIIGGVIVVNILLWALL